MFRPNNARYIINEPERTVICISDGHYFDVVNKIDKYLTDKHISVFAEDMFISDRFIGVAKCHPEDEWNELAGKKVAYAKMCSEYNGAINGAIANISKKLTLAAALIDSKKSNNY